MNTIKYLSIILSLLLSFVACNDDLDNTRFDPENAKAGELLPIGDAYVLDATKVKDALVTFQWGKMDFGYQAAITYTLEADVAGNSFVNAQEITSTTALNTEITVGNMNSAMMQLQKLYEFADETEQLIEFRIKGSISKASEPIYTNIITSKITPYPDDVEYPKLRVVGEYCGWSHADAQGIYSFDGSDIYEGWVKLDGKGINGFKISGGVTDWDNGLGNWGLSDGQEETGEPATINLINDGGSKDIKVYSKKYYRFSFNKSTNVLTNLKSFDSFGIVGSALPNGWDGPDVVMDFDTEKQVFTALVTLTDGEIKFRADNDFGFNYGGAAGSLNEGGDNIAVTAGTYKITVNINNPNDLKYKIETGEALDPSKIIAQKLANIGNFELEKSRSKEFSWTALDFGGQDPSRVTYELQMDLQGANFANVQILASTTDTKGSISGENFLKALQVLDATIDLEIAKDLEFRVVAVVSGLNNPIISNVETANAKVIADPIFPSELYMTGDEFGAWNWADPEVVTMTPVHGTPGAFWIIKYFTAGKGFKWAPAKAWSGDFKGLDTNIGFSTDNANAEVTVSGLYMVYVDLASKTIKFEEPLVYGMGDAFGGWNTKSYKFDLEGNNLTYSPTIASNELRMYAISSISTVLEGDWWKMEFILRDGKIEYRGAGDDQNPRVAVEAGKKISLDFATNTGSIQ